MGERTGKDFGIGVIDINTPNALFNFLKFIISHNTSTSVIEAGKLSLFDFVSFMYIINKFNEAKQVDSPTPAGKSESEMLGM